MGAALLPILLAAALGGCGVDLCGNRMLTQIAAPGGRHAAAVFVRDCGATTGFSTQVSLVQPGETPRDAGNVFVVDGEGQVLRVDWRGPDRLRITYRRGTATFLQAGTYDGVRIDYLVQ